MVPSKVFESWQNLHKIKNWKHNNQMNDEIPIKYILDFFILPHYSALSKHTNLPLNGSYDKIC